MVLQYILPRFCTPQNSPLPAVVVDWYNSSKIGDSCRFLVQARSSELGEMSRADNVSIGGPENRDIFRLQNCIHRTRYGPSYQPTPSASFVQSRFVTSTLLGTMIPCFRLHHVANKCIPHSVLICDHLVICSITVYMLQASK